MNGDETKTSRFFILKILNECKKNYFAVCYSIKSIQLKFSFLLEF